MSVAAAPLVVSATPIVGPQQQPPAIAVQRSSLDEVSSTTSHGGERPSGDAQWGANFWVTLSDPQTGAQFFACPSTGECSWEPPVGNFVLPPSDSGQWWELSDETRGGLPYYYHTVTGETRWEKPQDEFVIPLRVIQTTTLGRRLSVTAMSKRASIGQPSPQETTPEVNEQRPAAKRSQTNPSQPQRPANTTRTVSERAPGNLTLSTTIPTAGGTKPRSAGVPPSPTRPRASSSLANPRVPQQSLDAAAQMLASRPSDAGSSSSRRSTSQQHSSPTAAATHHPHHANGSAPTTPTNEKRVRYPPELNRSGAGVNGHAVVPPVPPSPRRAAQGLPADRTTRPRRPTNASIKDISGPIVDPDAAKKMSPMKTATGRPIPTRDLQVQTKRLSTGDHHILPRGLVEDIQQFQVEDFAKRYFSTHRAGFLFRRRVPVEQLMVWQKAPLSHPLLVLNRILHKDAVKMFKIIQRIMGDRGGHDRPTGVRMPSERDGNASGRNSDRESEGGNGFRGGFVSLLEEERWLLAEGLLHGELRDEIYCQVVKQLSKNPSAESVFKGWQLLCVLLIVFPPSKNFEAYLRSFMREHTTHKAGRIDVMARYCLAKLSVIARKGPRGKPPTIQEIEVASDAAFNPSTFGESLLAIFKMQERTYPTAKVPIVLPFLSDGILALGGMKAEGIFRVPGESDVVADLRTRIDRGYYNLEGIDDPHVPASLFKLWLRELQDPLIPDELYDECIASAEDPEKVVQIVRERLPVIHRRVLLFVVSFLQMFLQNEVMAVTKMPAPNMALVFAPNILRCGSENMAVVFTNARFEQIFVHNLLLHCNCATLDPEYVPVHGVGPQ